MIYGVVWRRLRTRIVWIGSSIAILRTAREGKEITNVVWLMGKQGSVTRSVVDIIRVIWALKDVFPIVIPVRVGEYSVTELANPRKSTVLGAHQVGVHESKSTETKHEAENSNATTGGRNFIAAAALGEPNASLTRIHDD